MDKVFRTSDGATLAYSIDGEGLPLLLLPGWSQSAAMFRNQIASFSKSRRVIALDFRGHGKSKDADHGFRVSRFARDVQELLDHEGLDEVSALGWSMGASVLWSFIDLFGTGRLKSLIFVDEPAAVMNQPGMDDGANADAGAIFDAGRPDIDNRRTRLDEIAGDHRRPAHGGDQNVAFPAHGRQIGCLGMADGHGGVLVQQ